MSFATSALWAYQDWGYVQRPYADLIRLSCYWHVYVAVALHSLPPARCGEVAYTLRTHAHRGARLEGTVVAWRGAHHPFVSHHQAE